MRVILASKSPRRKLLLEQLGLKPEVIVSGVDESGVGGEPTILVQKLARMKAEDVARKLGGNCIVIGGDSITFLNGEIIGKPRDREDGKRILKNFSGKKHYVFTGFCVINTSTGEVFTDYVKSTVWFRELSDYDIEFCMGVDGVMGGAGAYIPETHSRLFDRIEGSYTNIMGLPIERVIPALRKMGIRVYVK